MNRKRAIIVNTAIIFSFFLVFLRLSDLMLFNHKRLSKKAEQQHIKVEERLVRRGMIFDRRGRELALNLELESLYCDPKDFQYKDDKIKILASLMSKRPADIISKISEGGRFVWIDRKLDPATADKIKKLDIKGLGFVPEAKILSEG